MLPLIAAAVSLFYFSAVPIHIAVRLHIDQSSFFGVGISVFEPRFAIRQSARKRQPSAKTPSALSVFSKAVSLRSGLSFLKTILRHVRIESVHLDGSFGSGDAALTALICGGASALGCAFCAGRKAHLSIRPDFTADMLRAELSGMICVRAGHIMLAALLGAFQYGSRRIRKWTSIPSKAL